MLHILFWIIVITYFAWGFGFNDHWKASVLNSIFYLPGHLLAVYMNIYFLVPRYLIHKKYFKFALGVILVVACCSAYAWTMQLVLSASDKYHGYNMLTGMTILPFIHISGIAISIKLLSFWYQQKQQTLEAQQQRTKAELEMLKSQLHPHFLFNTLNNLYAFTLEKSPKAPEIVLKLSALLRFMIYESNTRFIPLSEEIDLLHHYIELEKLRYGDRLDISVVISGEIYQYQIAPLLLLPLVENAFKHGTSEQIDQCWVSLNLSVMEGIMHFQLVNSLDKEQHMDKHTSGGVGLQNLNRRLKLIYDGHCNLEAFIQEEIYIVKLDITLDPLKKEAFQDNRNIKEFG
ncbi:sensor histidine kinase [Pedobacter sp.]|uniref:sensor histidine kinase n=1 Tax=Pedobacter sp. TaxID=1411316 RepID=UPI003D7F4DE1